MTIDLGPVSTRDTLHGRLGVGKLSRRGDCLVTVVR